MKKVRIQNFQCHEDLEIEFDKITTIVGPTDGGKSAVYRALKWVMLNVPRGDRFIRRPKGKHTATISLDVDNKTIKRIRGKDINLYQMNNQKYKSFVYDVPVDIVKFLNVSALNFQDQHDPPFWFTLTAGEVSRNLNQIIDLSLIDTSLSNIDSMARKAKTEVDIIQDRIKTLKIEGKKLKWVLKADKELKQIEEYQKRLAETAQNRVFLSETIKATIEHEKQQESALKQLRKGVDIVKIGDKWKNLYEDTDYLQKTIEKIEKLEKTCKRKIPDISSLEEISKKISVNSDNKVELANAIRRIEQINIKNMEQELESLEKRLKKEMGDRCLLCGSQIK